LLVVAEAGKPLLVLAVAEVVGQVVIELGHRLVFQGVLYMA
jgi:hypothetical protein